MLNSIKKYSKTFLFKVLVGIIILPFLFWGMGDVFSGGSQNVVAKIDSEKVSTRDFVNYLRVLDLNDQERKNFSKTDLIERILADYIGKRVLVLELSDLNVTISDLTLKDLIVNDKTFFKNDKFSRTEYEKFLVTNNLSAPLFENNIAEQEKKRQLLSYLSEGIDIPNLLVQYEFNKENQTKKIDYINLKNYYNKPISEKQFLDVYNKNKEFYTEIFKDFKFAELNPLSLIGKKEYNENFFNKISEIENESLDNTNLDNIINDYNLSLKKTGLINSKNKKSNGEENTSISEKILEKLFKIEKKDITEFITVEDKYYIAELIETSKIYKDKNSKEVIDSVNAQIIIEKKIAGNSKFAKDISNNKFTKNQMSLFAKENNLKVESVTLKEIKSNKIFSTGVIKRIFETDDRSINLITDKMLKDNFIIYTKETNLPKIKPDNENYEQYKLKAKLRLANEIYNIFDLNLNKKYKVEINNKALNRIKNSF